MKSGKVTLIITVFNEQQSIGAFIDSIRSQTLIPDEIIVVDGGSTDNTLSRIKEKVAFYKNKLNIKLIIKKGNRSVGRNEAISRSRNEIIAVTDAGCIVDKKWTQKVTRPFKSKEVDVVAGYYKGKAESLFQKALVPYVLVMSDKVNKNNFLPSTRSMAFKKSIWNDVGGFDEKLSHNEDYIFANKLKEIGAKIVFKKNAFVNWIPRKNLKEAFIMFFRFAFGDAEAGIIRDKVLLIFARYLFYLYLSSLLILNKSFLLLLFIILISAIYILWSIRKNYKYVKSKKACFLLPLLQIVSDFAVLTGTSFGLIKCLLKLDYKTTLKRNVALIISLMIYITTMLVVIGSGIPNQNHPFPYQMDEWHQMQSVRNVFKYGSPNFLGSANGSMFHFYLTGILLIPLYLLKIINPSVIHSAVDALQEQAKLFIALRLTTLMFGVGSLILMARTARMLKLNSSLAIILFLATPVWLSLSNFFKYDIALTFWIILSLYFLIKYSFSPTFKNFLLSCFFSGLSFSVKVSALPLLPILIFCYFYFTPSNQKKYTDVFLGIMTYVLTIIFFGIPDTVFNGRGMFIYLYENLIFLPKTTGNYNLADTYLNYTLLHKIPAIFGHFLYILTIFSVVYVLLSILISFIKKNYGKNFKIKIFIIISFFLFALSVSTLKIFINANRALVLLPFVVIINLLFLDKLYLFIKNNLKLKKIIIVLFSLLFLIQIFESYLWIALKVSVLPQEASSRWIINNISKHSNIGLENVPIYQFEPDFILKDFYKKQYIPSYNSYYNYNVIDSGSKNLPEYILISNVNYEHKYFRFSNKNNLVDRLKKERYRKIAYFTWNLSLYSIFDNYFYYPSLGLFAYPEDITVYKK